MGREIDRACRQIAGSGLPPWLEFAQAETIERTARLVVTAVLADTGIRSNTKEEHKAFAENGSDPW